MCGLPSAPAVLHWLHKGHQWISYCNLHASRCPLHGVLHTSWHRRLASGPRRNFCGPPDGDISFLIAGDFHYRYNFAPAQAHASQQAHGFHQCPRHPEGLQAGTEPQAADQSGQHVSTVTFVSPGISLIENHPPIAWCTCYGTMSARLLDAMVFMLCKLHHALRAAVSEALCLV